MALAKKSVIIIAGPTAVGKTAVAIEVAKHFQTEIISADSRQCFKELNIGVARPSKEELQKVKHHFIASHSIQEEVTAATFEKYALDKVNELFEKHDIVIMAGGTGLYIKAFCEGLDEVPAINTEVRNVIMTNYNNGGIEWLREQVEKNDPIFYLQGETQNPQRMMRALEVKLSTGRSILSFHSRLKKKRDFNIVKIGLQLPKEELHQQIHNRVDKMIEQGLVEEVKRLQPFKPLNALQTVGYSEIFDYIYGKISLEDVINEIKKNTRQYAKRQMTWFRKDKELKWFQPSEVQIIKEHLADALSL
jgi:tRNA dimethylallyltransferase